MSLDSKKGINLSFGLVIRHKDGNPEEFSRALQLDPTYLSPPDSEKEWDIWRYDLDGTSIDQLVSALHERINPSHDAIRQIAIEHKVRFDAGIFFDADDYVALTRVFSPESLTLLQGYGLEIWISIYPNVGREGYFE